MNIKSIGSKIKGNPTMVEGTVKGTERSVYKTLCPKIG